MLFCRVQTLDLKTVPPHLYKKMYILNYAFKNYKPREKKFLMRKKLVYYRRNGEAFVHYIMDIEGRLAAWALSFETEGFITGYRWHTHFYTRSAYRRRGLGTKLAREAKRFISRRFNVAPRVYPHDDRSHGFFRRCCDETVTSL